MDKFTAANNMTLFLLEHTDSVCGEWTGRLPAAQQRELFGRFLGKGKITIDGEREYLIHTKKIAYGMDYEQTFYRPWSQLEGV